MTIAAMDIEAANKSFLERFAQASEHLTQRVHRAIEKSNYHPQRRWLVAAGCPIRGQPPASKGKGLFDYNRMNRFYYPYVTTTRGGGLNRSIKNGCIF